MIWYWDLIYLKPIPKYMLSKAFWEYIETQEPEIFKAAAGFMRTYYYLIQHEIDFRKAASSELQLLPKDMNLTFEAFAEFITPFSQIPNSDVSPRYTCGSIRLSRLNYLIWLRGKFTYFHIHTQWRAYFAHLAAPILSLFLVVSTILNAFQVALSVGSLDPGRVGEQFRVMCWLFTLIVLGLMAAFLFALGLVGGYWIISQFCFSASMLRSKTTGREPRPQAALVTV